MGGLAVWGRSLDRSTMALQHITVECTDLCENITACCKPVSYGRDLPSIFGIAVGNFIGAFKALSLLATAGSRHAISNLEEGFSG